MPVFFKGAVKFTTPFVLFKNTSCRDEGICVIAGGKRGDFNHVPRLRCVNKVAAAHIDAYVVNAGILIRIMEKYDIAGAQILTRDGHAMRRLVCRDTV